MEQAPPLPPERWHARFQQQAAWTRQIRRHLAAQLGISAGVRVLEAGCGTGAVTAELWQSGPARVHGVDLSARFLHQAAANDPRSAYTCGDVYHLPYANASFDHCVSHFLFLWLASPLPALREMMRVTRRGGYVILFAEPDYPARVDYPQPLARLGVLQTQSLADQGANPAVGRESAHWLVQAGCVDVHSGLTGGQWGDSPDPAFIRSEQDTLRGDLSGRLPAAELESLLTLDRQAWLGGYRILYVPTFYAWGRVP
jgi:ubiquinone/menaquinone biosynthesis C-methylase UbiE